MSNYPEHMHQPPNPADLVRVPPASPDCARVRGMLRDHADSDLSPAATELVDQHVHTCRTCAVELARAEHEVLQLRRAFGELRVLEPALPADFAARVVEHVVLTEPGDLAAGDASEVHPLSHHPLNQSGLAPATGRSATQAGARGEAARRGRWFAGQRDRAISPEALTLSAVAMLLLLGVGMRLLGLPKVAPDHAPTIVVRDAAESFDEGGRRLGVGDILGELQSLWVRRGGRLRFDWRDASERIQPAATLEVVGGEVQLKNGAPLLKGGRARIETYRDVEIPLADGSRVLLGVGDYVLSSEVPIDMLDDRRFDPTWDGESMFADDLRVEVEVLDGEQAFVVRAGVSPSVVPVPVGTVATYTGTGVVQMSPGVAVAGGNAVRRDEAGPATPEVAVLSGHVVDPGGLPGVGVTVVASYTGKNGAVTGTTTSGANGGFALQAPADVRSRFAIVEARPSVMRSNLGMVVPTPIPTRLDGPSGQLKRSLKLVNSVGLHGAIVDESGAHLGGVDLVPLVVDELFGTVHDLGVQKQSGSAGGFHIAQLPGVLPPHQRLVLLCAHPAYECKVVPVPARASAAATFGQIQVTMRPLESIVVRLLQPNTTSVVFEEIAGLPPGTGVVRREVEAGPIGQAVGVPVGSGRLWLRAGSADQPLVRELVDDGQFANMRRVRPSGLLYGQFSIFHRTYPVGEYGTRVARSYRYSGFETQEDAPLNPSPLLGVRDASGHGVYACEVYAVARGTCRDQAVPRLLGLTNDQGVLSLGWLDPGEDLFVVAPDGSIASAEQPTEFPVWGEITVNLQPAGRVLLDESLRPVGGEGVVEIALEMDKAPVGGMSMSAVRFASAASFWEVGAVPPGKYKITVGGTVFEDVEVPSTGFVELGQ